MSHIRAGLLIALFALTGLGVQAYSADCYTPPRNVTDYESLPLDKGYCHPNGWWVPGRPAAGMERMHIPQYFHGYLSRYNPGVMEEVLAGKGWDISKTGQLDGAAIMSCLPEYQGQNLYFRIPGETGWIGPLIIADCASYLDVYPVVYYSGFVLEVGFTTAERIGMAEQNENGQVRNLRGNIHVEVAIGTLPAGGEIPVDFPSWFLSAFRFSGGITSREAWQNHPDPRG